MIFNTDYELFSLRRFSIPVEIKDKSYEKDVSLIPHTTKKIAWITDSVACIPSEIVEKYNIHIIPLTIIHNGKEYKDGIDMTADEFYEALDGDNNLSTSQPSVGELMAFYENLKEDYDLGIAVHVSSKVSGTLNGSANAAEMVGFPLYAVDSKSGVGGTYDLLKKGIELHGEGMEPQAISESLTSKANKMRALLLIGNLEQFKRGGRLSNSQFVMGQLLRIKPIIAVEDGVILPKEKVRTMKRAERRVLDILMESIQNGADIKNVYLAHSTNLPKALEWKKLINDTHPTINVEINTLSPVLGAHAGKDTIGIFWREE